MLSVESASQLPSVQKTNRRSKKQAQPKSNNSRSRKSSQQQNPERIESHSIGVGEDLANESHDISMEESSVTTVRKPKKKSVSIGIQATPNELAEPTKGGNKRRGRKKSTTDKQQAPSTHSVACGLTPPRSLEPLSIQVDFNHEQISGHSSPRITSPLMSTWQQGRHGRHSSRRMSPRSQTPPVATSSPKRMRSPSPPQPQPQQRKSSKSPSHKATAGKASSKSPSKSNSKQSTSSNQSRKASSSKSRPSPAAASAAISSPLTSPITTSPSARKTYNSSLTATPVCLSITSSRRSSSVTSPAKIGRSDSTTSSPAPPQPAVSKASNDSSKSPTTKTNSSEKKRTDNMLSPKQAETSPQKSPNRSYFQSAFEQFLSGSSDSIDKSQSKDTTQSKTNSKQTTDKNTPSHRKQTAKRTKSSKELDDESSSKQLAAELIRQDLHEKPQRKAKATAKARLESSSDLTVPPLALKISDIKSVPNQNDISSSFDSADHLPSSFESLSDPPAPRADCLSETRVDSSGDLCIVFDSRKDLIVIDSDKNNDSVEEVRQQQSANAPPVSPRSPRTSRPKSTPSSRLRKRAAANSIELEQKRCVVVLDRLNTKKLSSTGSYFLPKRSKTSPAKKARSAAVVAAAKKAAQQLKQQLQSQTPVSVSPGQRTSHRKAKQVAMAKVCGGGTDNPIANTPSQQDTTLSTPTSVSPPVKDKNKNKKKSSPTVAPPENIPNVHDMSVMIIEPPPTLPSTAAPPASTNIIPPSDVPRQRPVNSEYEPLPLNKRKRKYMNDMGYSKPKRRRKKKNTGAAAAGSSGSVTSVGGTSSSGTGAGSTAASSSIASSSTAPSMTEEDNEVSADEEEMNDDEEDEEQEDGNESEEEDVSPAPTGPLVSLDTEEEEAEEEFPDIKRDSNGLLMLPKKKYQRAGLFSSTYKGDK